MFSSKRRSTLSYVLAMVIFGTIGIFRSFIELPSGVVVLFRCVIGMGFLLLVLALQKDRVRQGGLRGNLGRLLLSGFFLGMNWTLLFEAYRLTSVSTATLCYYMAPILVILLSPLLFGERLTRRKLLFAALAMLGMVLVSGAGAGSDGASGGKGIAAGLGAAAFYAAVIVTNKKISGVDPYDKTLAQLGAAALVLLPYVLLRGEFSGLRLTGTSLWLLLVVGVVHTGIAYILYVGALEKLEAQTAAFLSYLDPIVALLAAALFLRERMGLGGVLGSVLILGASWMSERSDAPNPSETSE